MLVTKGGGYLHSWKNGETEAQGIPALAAVAQWWDWTAVNLTSFLGSGSLPGRVGKSLRGTAEHGGGVGGGEAAPERQGPVGRGHSHGLGEN